MRISWPVLLISAIFLLSIFGFEFAFSNLDNKIIGWICIIFDKRAIRSAVEYVRHIRHERLQRAFIFSLYRSSAFFLYFGEEIARILSSAEYSSFILFFFFSILRRKIARISSAKGIFISALCIRTRVLHLSLLAAPLIKDYTDLIHESPAREGDEDVNSLGFKTNNRLKTGFFYFTMQLN